MCSASAPLRPRLNADFTLGRGKTVLLRQVGTSVPHIAKPLTEVLQVTQGLWQFTDCRSDRPAAPAQEPRAEHTER